MEWILIVLVIIPGKPAPTLSGRHSLLVTSHPILVRGWSSALAGAGWARQQRQPRARAPSALGTRAAQAGHWHCSGWTNALRQKAPKGQLDLNPSHPSQPSSAGLRLPLLEPGLRQECTGLGFHFWSIICTIYPLN